MHPINVSLSLLAMVYMLSIGPTFAAGTEVDAAIPEARRAFYALNPGNEALEHAAVAELIFPRVGKSGEGVAVDYGEGVLQVHGTTAGYYSVTGPSRGATLGVAYHEEVILFMSQKAADAFRSRREWVVGDDVGMVVIATRKTAESDQKALQKQVLGFVFAEEGLFDDLVLPGSVVRKIER